MDDLLTKVCMEEGKYWTWVFCDHEVAGFFGAFL